MILPIYLYGQPALRRATEEVSADSEGLKELISNMYETLTAAEGCGLAAPQIGKSIRLFVVDFPFVPVTKRTLEQSIPFFQK